MQSCQVAEQKNPEILYVQLYALLYYYCIKEVKGNAGLIGATGGGGGGG